MKRIILYLAVFILSTGSFSQTVNIISPSNKKHLWGAAGSNVPITVTYSVNNCNLNRIKNVKCQPVYSIGNAPSTIVVFNSVAFSAAPAVPNPPNGTISINIITPSKVPDKDIQAVFRFQLTLTDTVIFNYDTLTLYSLPKHPKWTKDKSNTFKSEITQFTDFTGFDNQKPNGILQEELVLKFPISKYKHDTKNKNIQYQLLRSVVFTTLFNRIDKTKEYQTYPTGTVLPNNLNNTDSIKPFLTTMDIYKYSNLQMGMNFNFFTLHTANSRINLSYEFAVLRNRPYITDTIIYQNKQFTKADLRPFYSFAHKFEVYMNNSDLIEKSVGYALNGGIMLVRLKDSYFKQYDAAEIDPFDRATKLLPANDPYIRRKARPIWFFGGTLKKLWGDGNKNTAFVRLNYFYQTGKYIRYTGSSDISQGSFDPRLFRETWYHNHFLQLQMGLSLEINKFLGAEKK